MPLSHRLLSSLYALALCAFFSGCESPPPPHAGDHEATAVRAVGLRGEMNYFDGQLLAEATVSRGRPVPFKNEGEGPGGGGARRGGGRGGRRHGGGGGGMGSGGDYARGGETDEGDPMPHMRASSLPPVTLRLKLTNLSKAPLDIQIRDVKSDLGDFAVRPERLLLAPGQAGEVDPMISQLGAPADDFPVTVSLRTDGKTESHDLILHPIAQATAEPK